MAFSKGQHFSLAFCNDAFAAVATAAAVAADDNGDGGAIAVHFVLASCVCVSVCPQSVILRRA